MHERFYLYRGFEIALQVAPVIASPRDACSAEPVRYRCVVRIRESGSVLRLDAFAVEHAGNRSFHDEFEAMLHGCYAAEKSVSTHIAVKTQASRHDCEEALCL